MESMKIPDSIRIGGVEYAVKESDGCLRNGNELLYGQINYEDCTITLSSTDGTSHQKRCLTMLHEIVHGIYESASAHPDNEKEEERVCEIIAKGMYQVLQDNGTRFFDIATGGKKENT